MPLFKLENALTAIPIPPDKSNGYEAAAECFMSARNPRIGAVTVRRRRQILSPRCSVLDLGCGHGVPVSQTLIEQGFTIYGVDASRKLVAAFRNRFPDASAECSAVEDSEFFGRTFDGVIAWGLLFVLPPKFQSVVIRKVARALNLGGTFLFTSPKESVKWRDALTDHESISLGTEQYQRILQAEGLVPIGEQCDEGDNYYYLSSKL